MTHRNRAHQAHPTSHVDAAGSAWRHAAAAVVTLVLSMIPTSGCDTISKLRSSLRGEGAGLQIDVEPASGITILLDEKEVAQSSPYVNKGLSEGKHVLEIRAAGYHSLTLPFELETGEILVVPVALRAAPAVITRPPPTTPDAPPPPPEPAAPPLPAGVQPIALTVVADPAATVLVDGVPVTGKELRLARVYGTLGVAGMSLSYRVGGSGILELTVPQDGASWTRDSNIILPGNSFRLLAGATRVSRIDAEANTQSLIMRR